MTTDRDHAKTAPASERRELYATTTADLIRRYGEDVGSWLAPRVGKMFKRAKARGLEDGQSSNFRVCDLANPEEVAEFERIRSEGCDGSYEAEVHHYASGRRFRVGFNYGH